MPAAVPSPHDLTTLLTNFGVAIAFIAVAAGTIWKTVRKANAEFDLENGSSRVDKVIGGAIMDTTTLLMWQESNRNVVEALDRVCICIEGMSRQMEIDREVEKALRGRR